MAPDTAKIEATALDAEELSYLRQLFKQPGEMRESEGTVFVSFARATVLFYALYLVHVAFWYYPRGNQNIERLQAWCLVSLGKVAVKPLLVWSRIRKGRRWGECHSLKVTGPRCRSGSTTIFSRTVPFVRVSAYS